MTVRDAGVTQRARHDPEQREGAVTKIASNSPSLYRQMQGVYGTAAEPRGPVLYAAFGVSVPPSSSTASLSKAMNESTSAVLL
jgi:hypothetical protein